MLSITASFIDVSRCLFGFVMFYVYCPVSQKQRNQMAVCHQECLPRQNTDTPCHQSE